MDRNAFVFSTTGFLLIIPAIILAASFMAMLETGSSGVFIHIRGDKTFSLFETAETDLDRAIDISGRRAVIAASDYVLTYGECLNSSTYNTGYGTGAIGAIKELMTTGDLTSVNHGVFNSSLTPGATLEDWTNAFPGRTDALGFNVSLTMSSGDLYITPVNDTWFYAIFRVSAIINHVGGNITYDGSLPRRGNTTRLIPGSGINASIFNCTESSSNPPPSSDISAPTNLSSVSCNTNGINGSATDDSGVSRVDVNVSGTWTQATLSDPGAASTSWSMNWTPGADGSYLVCSRATDDDNAAQLQDYCITVAVSGCSVGTCNIILDSSYTPQTINAGNRRHRVRVRVINNDPALGVTVDNMTVSWSKPSVEMDRIRYGNTNHYNDPCQSNNSLTDITDKLISSGGTEQIELRFWNTATCPSNSGKPDMRDVYYTTVFGTDQGTCSVDFYVCPTCD